jgi:pantoate--beta-alanine ligase
MLVLRMTEAVRARRRELWHQGARVALVPTMGAFHEGHLRLVDRARDLADEVWVSLFVNPTQFAPGEDFERYPRDEERDFRLLEARGAAVVFAPTVKELYPRPSALVLDAPSLTGGLCGAHRPGHFQGVLLVVAKLLNVSRPEVAVFGAKDFQQAVLIRRMVEDLDIGVRIEVVPTVREEDGLAMSSRNAYLAPAERRAAAVLPRALAAAAAAVERGERRGAELEAVMAACVAEEEEARLQYAAAVDPETLHPVEMVEGRVLLALAVHVGGTRLIDNQMVEVA